MVATEAADNDDKQDNRQWAMDGDSMVQRPSTATSCVGHPRGKKKFWWHRIWCQEKFYLPKDCFEYHDGTGLKIRGRQLQWWAGCNFGLINYSSNFCLFLVPAKMSIVGFYLNSLISSVKLCFCCADTQIHIQNDHFLSAQADNSICGIDNTLCEKLEPLQICNC